MWDLGVNGAEENNYKSNLKHGETMFKLFNCFYTKPLLPFWNPNQKKKTLKWISILEYPKQSPTQNW
jgi:hypothetical protein